MKQLIWEIKREIYNYFNKEDRRKFWLIVKATFNGQADIFHRLWIYVVYASALCFIFSMSVTAYRNAIEGRSAMSPLGTAVVCSWFFYVTIRSLINYRELKREAKRNATASSEWFKAYSELEKAYLKQEKANRND